MTAGYRAVWVANHPPLHYVRRAPLMWFAEATDRPDGGLLLMRFANIAFAAVSFVFANTAGYGDGRRRSPRWASAAAAIVGLVPQGHGFCAGSTTDWRSPPVPSWSGQEGDV